MIQVVDAAIFFMRARAAVEVERRPPNLTVGAVVVVASTHPVPP
jgi:hypothetical protein